MLVPSLLRGFVERERERPRESMDRRDQWALPSLSEEKHQVVKLADVPPLPQECCK